MAAVKRDIPPNPQINLNVNLNLPPGLDPQNLPQDLQNIIKKVLDEVGQTLPELVNKEITRQSPVSGIELRTSGARWDEKTDV